MSFTPTIPGEHVVHLTLIATDETHIANSPFSIPVLDAIDHGKERRARERRREGEGEVADKTRAKLEERALGQKRDANVESTGEEVDQSRTVIDLDHPVQLSNNVFGFPIAAKNAQGNPMRLSLQFRARITGPEGLGESFHSFVSSLIHAFKSFLSSSSLCTNIILSRCAEQSSGD